MIEVELKIKIESYEETSHKLLSMGFVKASRVLEEDKYFDNEAGQIVHGHQAMRIRKVVDLDTDQVSYQVNFKDKKLDEISMTRPEYETAVADAVALEKILNGLGFHAVKPFVCKERQTFLRDQVTACMDLVEGLGPFLELETIVSEETDASHALDDLKQIMFQLGLMMEDTTRKSYLRQLVEKMKNE